ncbi:hypothetical protein SERLA73DRAFT_38190, partial [Serpula lacrymans var. lacrymans S7.3]
LTKLISNWEKHPHAKPSNRKEKRALKLLNRLKFVAKNLQGSYDYKLCRKNKICALIKQFATPALFLTLNPADVCNPLLAVIGGMSAEQCMAMNTFQRGMFVANNSGVAAQFFDSLIKGFIDIILHYKKGFGLFGRYKAYYGIVE